MRRGGARRPVKGQRATKPGGRKVSTAPVSGAEPREQIARLMQDRDEALEQLAATSNVLQVISSSTGDLKPVFESILVNATRICEASFANLVLVEGDEGRMAAMHGAPRAFEEALRRNPVVPRQSPVGQVIQTKRPVHIADIQTVEPYRNLRLAKKGGARTTLGVPMLKDDQIIGAILIYRQEVRPFNAKQVDLVTNFAAQAVIAIENARLLNELRQSLEQQTATSEVLKVISSSPGELKPVFNAMLESAVRLCEAKLGSLFLSEGNDTYRTAALYGAPPAFAEARWKNPVIKASPGAGLDRAAATKEPVQILDIRNDPAYTRDPSRAAFLELAGARTVLNVPMLKDNELVGQIGIYRQEVRSFTDKQIELVKNFAAQAVIAIENARLLNELRQRTNDLSEALEQQTASSEVLKVISSSPGELEPVFEGVLRNATHICAAKFGILFQHEGDTFRTAAVQAVPPAFIEYLQRGPHHPGPESGIGQMVQTRGVIHVLDAREGRAYINRDPFRIAAVELAGVRTFLSVPMIKDDELVGSISIFRQEVRPFTDKQIELVQNFAAQAVIAIENTRLLNDLNKLNRQLEQRVADQVGEIERMGRLRRFLPPQVADLIVASGTEKQLESHRREITALFCDLRGFTGFSESSDPEDVMALLREYHAAIGGIINKYGGTLERYAGDGVMVVFNDPIPVDNPALQAVLMAIDMRAAIGELIEKWRKLGHDIGFGIGIAHGFATLGTIGFEGRFDYAAIGTVSNVASRLCDEAKPGQILISPRVLMAVEKDITVEPVGDFALKGIRRPLAAYNVLATKSAD